MTVGGTGVTVGMFSVGTIRARVLVGGGASRVDSGTSAAKVGEAKSVGVGGRVGSTTIAIGVIRLLTSTPGKGVRVMLGVNEGVRLGGISVAVALGCAATPATPDGEFWLMKAAKLTPSTKAAINAPIRTIGTGEGRSAPSYKSASPASESAGSGALARIGVRRGRGAAGGSAEAAFGVPRRAAPHVVQRSASSGWRAAQIGQVWVGAFARFIAHYYNRQRQVWRKSVA